LLTFFIEDISSEPSVDYELFLEIDNDDYEESWSYDENEEMFIVEFIIDIDEEDIEDEYDIELYIEDEDEDEVYDDDFEIEVDTLIKEDDFDWGDLEVTANYDEDDEVLYVELVLEDITTSPWLSYEVSLEFDGEDESEDFIYSSVNDELRASIEVDIDEDDIENDYEFDIQIEDENGDDVFDEEIDVDVDEYEEEELEEENEDDDERYISSSTRSAINNFVAKTYAKYSDESDAIAYFEIVIITFDNFANINTGYRKVVDDINYLLQEEIDSY
jgi:hypothetical protein